MYWTFGVISFLRRTRVQKLLRPIEKRVRLKPAFARATDKEIVTPRSSLCIARDMEINNTG